MGKKNIGSSFDKFLKEDGTLEEATALALKRVIAWQIAKEMESQQITKTDLAKRMHTSRAALNRLLDKEDTSLTLTTLASAAAALGKTINFQFSASHLSDRICATEVGDARIPTLILFPDRQEPKRMSGALDAAALSRFSAARD